jgi:two-component system sensor histidine kinase YesM
MDEDAIEALNEEIGRQPVYDSLRRSEQDELGLQNIGQRVKLLYGEGASLTVDGSPGQGLAVTITILLPAEGADEDV